MAKDVSSSSHAVFTSIFIILQWAISCHRNVLKYLFSPVLSCSSSSLCIIDEDTLPTEVSNQSVTTPLSEKVYLSLLLQLQKKEWEGRAWKSCTGILCSQASCPPWHFLWYSRLILFFWVQWRLEEGVFFHGFVVLHCGWHAAKAVKQAPFNPICQIIWGFKAMHQRALSDHGLTKVSSEVWLWWCRGATLHQQLVWLYYQ